MDMKIEIFNVRHGHCTVITAPNGRRIMLDCGTRWDDDDFWTPSLHYFGERFEYVIPLNLDEDHLADFGNVQKNCQVATIMTNLSIGPREFAEMKKAGMGRGTTAYYNWLTGLPQPGGGSGLSPDFGAMEVRGYRNSYGAFTKSNDLSLAIFVKMGAFKILFAGDLEGPGWCGLLKDSQFVAELASVTVLVASHHGRRSGCHDPLFDHMTPHIVIISDDEKQHDTQETHGYYHWRCNGIPVIGTDRRRHVYTTRSDGNMHIDVRADSSWLITTGVKVQSWPMKQPVPPPMDSQLRNGLGAFGLFGQSSVLTDNALGLGALGLINRR
jgi:beta-lactamase superfamily II metal-dependent hydrolase